MNIGRPQDRGKGCGYSSASLPPALCGKARISSLEEGWGAIPPRSPHSPFYPGQFGRTTAVLDLRPLEERRGEGLGGQTPWNVDWAGPCSWTEWLRGFLPREGMREARPTEQATVSRQDWQKSPYFQLFTWAKPMHLVTGPPELSSAMGSCWSALRLHCSGRCAQCPGSGEESQEGEEGSSYAPALNMAKVATCLS